MQAPCLYLKPKACFSEARCGDHFVVSVVLAVDPRTPGGAVPYVAVVACLALPGVLRTGLFGSRVEIQTEFVLNGIWGSGGFRRVRSGVRIRKLLTRASGTLLASRLRRDKILDFERQM